MVFTGGAAHVSRVQIVERLDKIALIRRTPMAWFYLRFVFQQPRAVVKHLYALVLESNPRITCRSTCESRRGGGSVVYFLATYISRMCNFRKRNL